MFPVSVAPGERWFAHVSLRESWRQYLIEYSVGSYAETFGKLPWRAMFWPPAVKIYQDGKIIHYGGTDDGRYFVSQLTPEQLDSLKKRLAGEKYLSKSRFIEMDGDVINVHGGVSYIRYPDGDNEILLATGVLPRGGPWVQLTDAIGEYIPDDHTHVYYPAVIGVSVVEESPEYMDQTPVVWPFGKQIKFGVKLKKISDAEVIKYLFDRLHGVFSFYVWDFKQDNKTYSMFLNNSPGWFEPDYLNKAVAKLRDSGYRVKE